MIVMFTDAETACCRHLIELALAEDLGTAGDLTSQAIIPADLQGRAVVAARAAGVVAGLPAAKLVCAAVEPKLTFQPLLDDGTAVNKGDRIAVVSGPMRGILA